MQPIQRRILYGVILLAGLAWIYVSADQSGASTAGRIPAPQRGFLAPEFSLATPSGQKISLADLRGKAVLINLWATWCPPCQAEMPAIQKYYDQYKSEGLVVLAVDSTAQDNPLDVVPFVTQHNLTFPILLDETGEVAAKYNLQSLPSSFFVNRDGTINEVVVGAMSDAQIQTSIEAIIKSQE